MKMITGDVIYGTHADLLNSIGIRTKSGAKFEQYYKGTYELNSDTYIWIISIDGKERSGWINVWNGPEEIIEYNPEEYHHPIGLTHKYRIVFDKEREKHGNKFVFKGVFMLQPESSNKKRVLRKIDDNYELN